MEIKIRTVTAADAAKLLDIYAYYVKYTAVSFEYEVPDITEFEGRIVRTLEKYPYIAAEKDGRLVGYAYAGPFKARAAYGWSVETSIYVDKDERRSRVGSTLLVHLEDILKRQNILNVNACITMPSGSEDEYSSCDSVRFHERMGYRMVGTFTSCGYKFGRWYNMCWMEKMLGKHSAPALPVIPFPALDQKNSRK